MLCDECKKNPATVHMTKIINNQKSELHLCEKCAGKREDFNWFSPLSISDLLTGFLTPLKSTATSMIPAIKCSRCGMDYQQFKKAGRFGCENCYKAFKDEIYPVIKRIQGGATHHTGKVPQRHDSRIRTNRKIEDLKNRLREAVKDEAFEEAAVLRDKIRDLEKDREVGG